jgi:hypothetical protein
LGYVLTTDGIKPQQKKVQAILALMLPTGVKDLSRFLDIVQYYRDLSAKCSDMLVPLTSLVGECGHTKLTKALKTKKVPWHWDEVHQKAFDDVKAISPEIWLWPTLITQRNSRFTLMPHHNRWVQCSHNRMGAVIWSPATSYDRITLFSDFV